MGKVKKSLIAVTIVILTGWTFYQVTTLIVPKKEVKQDPYKMLYQVSLFQIELLNSYLIEAGNVQHTEQLHALKQAAYSANFTHERYVLALGESNLNHLTSITELMQYIIRMQIGGRRGLKEQEREVLSKVSSLFKEVYSAYETLLSSNGKVISTKRYELQIADEKISKYLRKMLLE